MQVVLQEYKGHRRERMRERIIRLCSWKRKWESDRREQEKEGVNYLEVLSLNHSSFASFLHCPLADSSFRDSVPRFVS